jgi:chaperonin cofactor prefoldin
VITVVEVGFRALEYQSERLNESERMWRERFTVLQTELAEHAHADGVHNERVHE